VAKILALATLLTWEIIGIIKFNVKPANRTNRNYKLEATEFPQISGGIIDIHSHIQGAVASQIYAQAAEHYGVSLTYSMTPLQEVETVRRVLGERIRFIAIPSFNFSDPESSFGRDFIRNLPAFKSHGASIAKFWNAPRIYEASDEPFASNRFRLNSVLRTDAMKAAADLGMIFMVHVADPDTWFSTKYRDSARYGTKLQQYEALEDVLSQFNLPWIAAHMGGYPENLEFLSGLLTRHNNLYLDCSATKWIVRELSKHEPAVVRAFFQRWSGRILFGSDIVTRDSHISADHSTNEMDAKASNESEAYDLYASRYWALRTLLESSHHGESPIADPDLHLVDPNSFTPLDAPTLRGITLDSPTLHSLYRGTAIKLTPV
jgi:hypothetical protein